MVRIRRRRIVLFMARNARARYRVISAVSYVTKRTVLPAVASRQRKSRRAVIKNLHNLARLYQVPPVTRVTLRAIIRKTGFSVVWVRCRGKVPRMTLIAALRQLYEFPVLMADIARQRGVDPTQTEPRCSLMAERVLIPRAARVTYPAVLGKSRLNVIGTFRPVKVLFVAGNAFRFLIAEISSPMACRTFLRRMRSR